MHRLLIAISCLTAFAVADSKSGEETPKYWRAILGDICQLPSFPRATGDPHRYVECVRQSTYSADRKDLGIWLLRECLPGYEFVASARRCKTIRSVKRQQELCDSNNATMYQFCPSNSSTEFLVEEIREAPRQCACPNGEDNCVCPSPEILEPVNVPINSEKARRSPISVSNCQTTTTQQQYCPQQQPAIVQPQPCPLVQGGGVQNAQYQGICSWMIDPLAVDPQSRTHYLQCQPAPNNLFCGRWQRMPCAPGTMFDVQAQVCVWDTQAAPAVLPQATAAPMPQAPQAPCSCVGGVQIGSCNQNYQCPGQSVCQVGQNAGQQCMVCCYFRRKSLRI
ncbi:hypothetical protein NECAME_04014 [Necator americanus]|uniref:Chitin-binding type-2 domain-containing protein n=1 Tax=Necator americanus TaxID=51031 RepID=W2SYB1_NECAM|nr:hypothetical protein NECAME_04014 [Necator americanus]ETN74528.1 hypothetical protein NECAME_04014 [Necator americanus]